MSSKGLQTCFLRLKTWLPFYFGPDFKCRLKGYRLESYVLKPDFHFILVLTTTIVWTGYGPVSYVFKHDFHLVLVLATSTVQTATDLLPSPGLSIHQSIRHSKLIEVPCILSPVPAWHQQHLWRRSSLKYQLVLHGSLKSIIGVFTSEIITINHLCHLLWPDPPGKNSILIIHGVL